MAHDDTKVTYEDLLERKEKVKIRLGELSSSGVDETQTFPGSKEVHWDLVMKEMVSFGS